MLLSSEAAFALFFFRVVGTGRFELPTFRLGGGCSIQLSYVPALDLL